MCCSLHRIVPFCLLLISLLLTACQVPLPYVPPPIMEAVAAAEATVESMPAEEDEEKIGSADVAESELGESSDTNAGDTNATENVAVEEAATDDAELDEATSDETAENKPITMSQSTARVLIPSLRIRSGPGATYEVLGGATAGESFPVVGEENDCEWLNIAHPTLDTAWISGAPEYTSMSTPCDQILVTSIEVVPGVTAEAEQAEREPKTSQDNTETQADAFPADQGCYLIQNQLGLDLIMTITALGRDWQDSFQIAADQELPYCLFPGSYSVVIDAPPPWADLNDALDVAAGDRYFWPIKSGE